MVRKYTLEFKKFTPEMTLKQYSKNKEVRALQFLYNEYIDQDGYVQTGKFNELVKKFVEEKGE